jgi:hypothetical protein
MPANHPGVSRDDYVAIGRVNVDVSRNPHADIFVRLK